MKTTISIMGIDFDVEFDYQAEEPMVRYYSDGSGYPGCPAEVEVTKITYKGDDFTELFEEDIEMVEEKVFEQLNN